jgi:hypothetical protein
MKRLTKQQSDFIDGLVDGKSRIQAYRDAYPNCKNDKCADVGACRLLKKPLVIATHAERMAEVREQAAAEGESIRDRLVGEYSRIAFLDPAMFFDKKGQLLNIHDMLPEVRAAIAGIEVRREKSRKMGKGSKTVVTDDIIKIKISSKQSALDSLSKIHGLFNEGGILTAEVLNAILGALPPNFADSVRAELGKILSARRS